MEREIDYITKVISKLQRERIKSVEVKKEAVDDFDEYLEVLNFSTLSIFAMVNPVPPGILPSGTIQLKHCSFVYSRCFRPYILRNADHGTKWARRRDV